MSATGKKSESQRKKKESNDPRQPFTIAIKYVIRSTYPLFFTFSSLSPSPLPFEMVLRLPFASEIVGKRSNGICVKVSYLNDKRQGRVWH